MLLGTSPLACARVGGGRNLLVNGSFANDATGWTETTDTGANATLSSVGGVGRVTMSGAGVAVYSQAIPTIIGRTYRATGNLPGSTGTLSFYLCRKSDEASPATNIVTLKSGAGTFSTTFTATAATSYITCQVNASTAATADFDDLSVVAV